MEEQVCRCHREGHAIIGERLFELADDADALLGTCTKRYKIVVVQIDSVCPKLRQFLDDFNRTEWWTNNIAERIASRVANSPEAKGKFIFSGWLILVATN